MSIQKDLEGLVNQAIDAMETVRSKIVEAAELNNSVAAEVDKHATLFVNANEALMDIYSVVEDLDA